MAQIVTNTFFINDLHVPNSQNNDDIGLPSEGNTTIDNLNDCCVVVEKDLLLNALGLTLYNSLQTALINLPSAEQKWKDLVNGVEYDGKIWEGLNNPKSLIAYAVYYNFLNMDSEYWSTFGTVKGNAVNAENVSPFYKLTSAWTTFLKKYQVGACSSPDYYSGVGWEYVDYYGMHNSVNVSLYEFLRDKADVYNWTPDKFRYYNHVNTFGL